LRFLSQLLETAGLCIVISGRTLLHFPSPRPTYTYKQGEGVRFRKISDLDGQSYGAKRNGEICGFTKAKAPVSRGFRKTPKLN
jgi:hypothetical protein